MCIVCSLRRNICSSWESSLLNDEKEEEDGSGGGSIIVGIITEFKKTNFCSWRYGRLCTLLNDANYMQVDYTILFIIPIQFIPCYSSKKIGLQQ